MNKQVMLVDDRGETVSFLRTCIATVQPPVQIVGEARDGHQAVSMAREKRPDIVLMDFMLLPDITGLEASRQILDIAPDTRVILITGWGDLWLPEKARELGIFGFWKKGGSALALIDLVTSALQPPGREVGPYRSHASWHKENSSSPRLTDQESKVLRLVAAGKTNKEISRILDLAERTVEFHLGNAFQKLGLTSRVQAALWAKDHGLSG